MTYFDWNMFFYVFFVLGSVVSASYGLWYLHPETEMERRYKSPKRGDEAFFPGI